MAHNNRPKFEVPTEYISVLREVLLGSPYSHLFDSPTREKTIELDKLSKHVNEISTGLTRDRGQFLGKDYFKNEHQLLAYLIYFTTTNFPKLWVPLREIAQSGYFEDKTSLSVLDVGTGTGAGSVGLLTWLNEEQQQIGSLNLTMSDKSAVVLAAASKLVRTVASRTTLHDFKLSSKSIDLNVKSLAKHFPKQFDLVVLMNVLNELQQESGEYLLHTITEALDEDGFCILIEPATKNESRRTLEFRDYASDHGFYIYAPCVRRSNCPALETTDNWCHTELEWERPAFIGEIDRRIENVRLSLKCTYFIIGKKDRNLADRYQPVRDFSHVGRIVSENFREKGRNRMWVCNELGRRSYIMNARDITEANTEMSVAERYDLVTLQGTEERIHDIKVGEKGVFNIESTNSGCEYVDNLDG